VNTAGVENKNKKPASAKPAGVPSSAARKNGKQPWRVILAPVIVAPDLAHLE
jgi:hypothetical protein